MHYDHTQKGWTLAAAMAIALGIAATVGLLSEVTTGLLGLLGLIIVVGLLFGWLRVTVNREQLQVRFGLGLIRRTVPLSSVRGYRPVRNAWYYGWGIRWFPGGVLYNVSGLDAVELRLEGGKLLRIGTDEPEALCAAIREVVGEPVPATPAEEARAGRGGLILGLAVFAFILIVVGGVAVMFHLQMQPPVATVSAQSLHVESFMYGQDFPLAQVTEAKLVDRLPTIRRRSNGFALGGTLRGHFELDDYGATRLYIEADQPPFVVLRLTEGYVVVNFEDPAQTRTLHTQLQAALAGR